MNWSPASAIDVGADQVAPLLKDWLTITFEFVVALYGSLGAGIVLFRMSDHTTARCPAWLGLGSAVMLPAAHVRKRLSWYVCLKKAIG